MQRTWALVYGLFARSAKFVSLTIKRYCPFYKFLASSLPLIFSFPSQCAIESTLALDFSKICAYRVELVISTYRLKRSLFAWQHSVRKTYLLHGSRTHFFVNYLETLNGKVFQTFFSLCLLSVSVPLSLWVRECENSR